MFRESGAPGLVFHKFHVLFFTSAARDMPEISTVVSGIAWLGFIVPSRIRISVPQWICRHHFGEETLKHGATRSMTNPLAVHEEATTITRAPRVSG